MKTLKISKEEMLKRVSVFKDLKPLPIQLDKSIPQEGKDIVYARELLSIIGLENNSHNTPINKNAPITGAAGITMTIAKCPPNQGPGLHNHQATFETFTVLKGKAKISMRKIGNDKIYEFILDGDQPGYIDMPIWYTHNITNIGSEPLITSFWINEPYDPQDTDTYFENV
mgnify:CR=1 FL=1